jgi:hypothetical protein
MVVIHRLRLSSILIAALIASANTTAAPVVYLDETAFLNDLDAASYPVVHEGFENDDVWGEVRSSPSIIGYIVMNPKCISNFTE